MVLSSPPAQSVPHPVLPSEPAPASLVAAPPGRASRRHTLFLLLFCALFLWTGLGRIGLVDPDEPFYALTTREMLARGDLLVPHIFGAPQFEKPILYYWLTMGSFSLFGQTELAARLVPALFATLLVLLVHAFGSRLFRPRAGLFAALVLGSSVATLAMARTVLTDVVFAFFLTAALYTWWRALEEPSRGGRWVVLHFLSTGLAVLTKGPLGSLLPWLAIGTHRLLTRRRIAAPRRAVWLGLGLHASVVVPWFAYMLWRFGAGYFHAFFIHENLERLLVAEHPGNDHWFYYPMVLALGSLPWLPLLVLVLFRPRAGWRGAANAFLGCWFLTSLLFLSIAHSKLPSYVYFLFVPLALWAGDALDRLLSAGWTPRRRVLVLGLGLAQAVLLGVACLVKRDFASPELVGGLAATGAILAVGALLLARRASFAAVATTCCGMLVLKGALLGPGAGPLGEMISVRDAAARIPASEPADRPVVTEKLLVRGVEWYTGRPVAVLTRDEQPFWTPQNVELLRSRAEVDRFLAREGGALYLRRPGKEDPHLVGGLERSKQDARYYGRKLVTDLAP